MKVEEEEHAQVVHELIKSRCWVHVQDNTYQLSSDSYAIWACGDVDENANCA